MRILLCTGITCSSTRRTVNLHVELVSDDYSTNYSIDVQKSRQIVGKRVLFSIQDQQEAMRLIAYWQIVGPNPLKVLNNP
jgi:hypothetical protein